VLESNKLSLGHDAGIVRASFNNVNELLTLKAGGAMPLGGSSDRPVIAGAANVSETVTIGGTITASDVLWLSVHDTSLPQAENVSYTVQSGNSTTDCATGLKNAINANSTLTNLGITATSSGSTIFMTGSTSVGKTRISASKSTGATETLTLSETLGSTAGLSSSLHYAASPIVASGANSVNVTLESGGGTLVSKPMQLNIPSTSSSSHSYDANGNLTSDGTRSFSWDAEDRLLQLTYPGSGNNTQFTYDPLGRCVKIVETVASSATSTKQFVRCDGEICEERDGISSLSNGKQFFSLGQVNFASGTPTNYFYTTDHPGSVREMTKTVSGTTTIEAQYAYSPFGEVTKLQGSADADRQFDGYYVHARSGLCLAQYRVYSPTLGIWLSREPLALTGETDYTFNFNNPISFVDLDGLLPNNFFGGHFNPGVPKGREDDQKRPRQTYPDQSPRIKKPTQCPDPSRGKGEKPRVPNNSQQNKMAQDALERVARSRGIKVNKELSREFHDWITGQGNKSFKELQTEARDFLEGRFGTP